VICLASARHERAVHLYGLEPQRVHALLFGVDERFYGPQEPPKTSTYSPWAVIGARDYGTFPPALEGLDAQSDHRRQRAQPARSGAAPTPSCGRTSHTNSGGILYAGAACVATRAEGYRTSRLLRARPSCSTDGMGRPVVASKRATVSDYVRGSEPPDDVW
jgi:hypothetical protein